MPNFHYKLTSDVAPDNGANTTIHFNKGNLGYAPDEAYCIHQIQMTGVDANGVTWGVEVMGCGGAWLALCSGLANNSIVVLTPFNQGFAVNGNGGTGAPFIGMGKFQQFRVVLSGTDASARAHVRSDLMQSTWG